MTRTIYFEKSTGNQIPEEEFFDRLYNHDDSDVDVYCECLECGRKLEVYECCSCGCED